MVIPCLSTLKLVDYLHVQIRLNKCADSEGVGDRGPDTPALLSNRETIGYLSNTGLDPLKFATLPSQH